MYRMHIVLCMLSKEMKNQCEVFPDSLIKISLLGTCAPVAICIVNILWLLATQVLTQSLRSHLKSHQCCHGL